MPRTSAYRLRASLEIRGFLVRIPTHRLFGLLGRAVTIGIAAAVAALGVLVAPAATIGGACLGVLVALLTSLQPRTPTAVKRATALLPHRNRALVVGGATTAVWLVVTGTVFLLGPASPIVLGTILLTGSPVIWLWRRHGATEPATCTTTPPVGAQPARFTVDQMSTAELCLSWRRSYWALQGESDGVARFAIVHMRQAMLDELERRDADGFGRWLGTGARAGSDPGRYLTTDT